ncbi:hypothetical protein BsWGS_04246 [Bradybaena similaris]
MSFCHDGVFFVTCGVHHVKFWYPVAPKKVPHKYTPLKPPITTLYGRPAILREIKHRLFVDVACGSEASCGFVYTVTKCGLVCKLSEVREVDMYKRLQNTQLSSLQVHSTKLMVGSKYGHIYFFDALSLQLKASVSLPLDICFAEQVLRCQGTSLEAAVEQHRSNIYLAYDHKHSLLTATLTSGSLCVWDVADWKNIKKNYYSVSHSSAISGLDLMKSNDSGKNKETMVTVSHDATVRLWNIVTCKGISCESSRTIYTEYDSKIQPLLKCIKSQENLLGMDGTKARIITAVKVCPERNLLVTGDSKGIISVYDRATLESVKNIVRHTRGITALQVLLHTNSGQHVQLLASGGRDRLINIYNMENFGLLNCLKLHSGTVTSLGMYATLKRIILLSSGLDRSLVVCKSERFLLPHFKPCHCRHPTSSVIDIVVCAQEGLVGVGRINGKVSIMDAETFIQLKRFNACPNTNSRLEKLQIHPKSNLMLSACSDRTVNILSFTHGVLLARVHGHAKSISGLNFSLNMKFIVSTSRDGCIFIWGIPESLIRPGVRVVQSALQTVEKRKPLLKAISVIQLRNTEFVKGNTRLQQVTRKKRNPSREISVTQQSYKVPSEQHKSEEQEETVSMEEFSVNDDASLQIKSFEKASSLPFSMTSASSSETRATGMSSKVSTDFLTSPDIEDTVHRANFVAV